MIAHENGAGAATPTPKNNSPSRKLYKKKPGKKPSDGPIEPTNAAMLVALAEKKYRFGRTDKDEPFAVEKNGPNIAIFFKGSRDALRAKLARQFRAETGRIPGASALADTMTVLDGEALNFDAEPVVLRVANHDDAIVIDLGGNDGRAVIVRGGSWQVAERSPVLFRRTALTLPMPVPQRGGTLNDLRRLLNINDETWPLVVGWLIAALMPDVPHPVLLLSGAQGSGKSCAARMLVNLCDPSSAPLRSEPRHIDDWQVQASASWVVCLDNLSSIPQWLSDAMCKAVTGDGLVKRKLYSNSDVAILAFRRVIVLTSIDLGALRGDLGERLLFADLDVIADFDRRTEKEIDAQFAEQLPRLFGALLDALAATLESLPYVQLERLPRMADFARVLAATDSAGITSGALDRYLGQSKRIAEDVVDADPFADALVQFIRARPTGQWEGTATELLTALLPVEQKPSVDWPKPQGVKGRLKRLKPALEKQGVEVDFPPRKGRAARRVITIRYASDVETSSTDPAACEITDTAGDVPGDIADGPNLDLLPDRQQYRQQDTAFPDEDLPASDDADDADDPIPPLSDSEWGDL